MDLTALTRPGKPWLHLLVASPADAFDALHVLDSRAAKLVVRTLRGAKATTKASLLDEMAAALQFPPTFGENWDALADCLTDLAWLRADAIVLGVLHSSKLLEKEPAEAGKLVAIIQETLKHWHHPPKGWSPKPFHVVLQALPAEADAVKKRWDSVGLALAKLA